MPALFRQATFNLFTVFSLVLKVAVMEFSPSPWPWDASFTFVVFGMFDLGRGVRSSLGVKPLIALVETAYLFHSPYQLIPVRETRVEEPNLKPFTFLQWSLTFVTGD